MEGGTTMIKGGGNAPVPICHRTSNVFQGGGKTYSSLHFWVGILVN